MRIHKGDLSLAKSSVRIACRRLREYHDMETIFVPEQDLARIDQLLRRAEECLGSDDIAPSF